MEETTNNEVGTATEGQTLSTDTSVTTNTSPSDDGGIDNANSTQANVSTNGVDADATLGDAEEEKVFSWSEANIPDGVTLSDEHKTKIEDWVSKIKTPQDLLDFAVEIGADAKMQREEQAKKDVQEQKERFDNTVKSWQESLKSDVDFGKNYDENMKKSQSVISKFGGAEMSKMIEDYGLTHNPLLNKFFVRVSKEFEDAKLIKGGVESSSNRVQRDRFSNPVLNFNKSFGEK